MFRSPATLEEDSDSDSISLASTAESDQDPDQTYLTEKILARKLDGKKPVYLVKWEGYDLDRCTWEPRNMFESKTIVDDYEKSLRDGTAEEFDYMAWEARQDRLRAEKEERQERREAKRERLERKRRGGKEKEREMEREMEKRRRKSARQDAREEKRKRRLMKRSQDLKEFVVDDGVVEYSDTDSLLDDGDEEDDDEEGDDEEVTNRARRKQTQRGRASRSPQTVQRRVPAKRPLALSRSPPRNKKTKKAPETLLTKKQPPPQQSRQEASSRKSKEKEKEGPPSRKGKEKDSTVAIKQAGHKPTKATAASTNPPTQKPPMGRAKRQSNQPQNQPPKTYERLSMLGRAQKRAGREPEPDRSAIILAKPGEAISDSLAELRQAREARARAAQEAAGRTGAPRPPPLAPPQPAPTAQPSSISAGSFIQAESEKLQRLREEERRKKETEEKASKIAEAKAKALLTAKSFGPPPRREEEDAIAMKRKRSPEQGVRFRSPSPANKRQAIVDADGDWNMDTVPPPPPPPLDHPPHAAPPLSEPPGPALTFREPPPLATPFSFELFYGPAGSALSVGDVRVQGWSRDFQKHLDSLQVKSLRISHSLDNDYIAKIFVPELGPPLELADMHGSETKMEPVESALGIFLGAGVIATDTFTMFIYMTRNANLCRALKNPQSTSRYKVAVYPPLGLPPPSRPQIAEPNVKYYPCKLLSLTRQIELGDPELHPDSKRPSQTIIFAPSFAEREVIDLSVTLEYFNHRIVPYTTAVPSFLAAIREGKPTNLNIFVHASYRDKLHIIPEIRTLHQATLTSTACRYTFFGMHLTYDPLTTQPSYRAPWQKFWRTGTLIFLTPSFVLSDETALDLVIKYTNTKSATTSLCIPSFLSNRVQDKVLSLATAALNTDGTQTALGLKYNAILRALWQLEDLVAAKAYPVLEIPPGTENCCEFDVLLDELTRLANERCTEYRRFLICRNPEVDLEKNGAASWYGRFEFVDVGGFRELWDRANHGVREKRPRAAGPER